MRDRIHLLKCVASAFQSVWDGEKPFEIRRTDDRDFCVGDVLCLRETVRGEYTGRVVLAMVSCIYEGAPYLPDRLAVLGLSKTTMAAWGEVEPLLGEFYDVVPPVPMVPRASDEAAS